MLNIDDIERKNLLLALIDATILNLITRECEVELIGIDAKEQSIFNISLGEYIADKLNEDIDPEKIDLLVSLYIEEYRASMIQEIVKEDE